MSTVEQNKALALSFMERLGAGDLEALGELFDDHSTWTITADDIPFAGTYAGGEIVETFLRPVRSSFSAGPTFEIVTVAGDGDWVAIEARGNGTFRNGVPYNNRYTFWLEIDRDTIKTVREYMDSYYVMKATGSLD